MAERASKDSHGLRHSEEFFKMVRLMDMELEADEDYLWIAEAAMKCPLGEEWKEFEDADGNPAYYHPRLKILQTTNPILDKFAAMFKRQKAYTTAMQRGPAPKTNIATRLSVIVNETLNRCHRGLPPVTPELVEKTCILLGINTGQQHLIARTVKMELDQFVEQQYELATAVGQVVDAEDFINNIRGVMIDLEVIRKPDDVIMCSEVPGRPAEVKCEQCKDFFSQAGFNLTHATGKRRGHSTLPVEQRVCTRYPDRLATCEVNGEFYCDEAYDDAVQEDPTLRKAPKKVLGGLKCSEIPTRVAEVLVEEEFELYCWEAFIKLHRKGKRRWTGCGGRLVPCVFDQDMHLWRAGEMLPQEEAQELIDRCRLTAEGGPWCAFRDDNQNTYWYHWTDKVIVTESPFRRKGNPALHAGG
jgi:hypothetical protein